MADEDHGTAFFITRIGLPGSDVRQRTDDIEEFVIGPVLAEKGLRAIRADRDAKPGRISDLIVQHIIDARVVVADVTGRNPNVFYELGIAHAFLKPVIPLVDAVEAIPFDTIDQNHIVIGDDGKLGANEAKRARTRFAAALDAVLADDFEPTSPVTAAHQRARIAAIDNPTEKAIAELQRQVDEMRAELRQGSRRTTALAEGLDWEFDESGTVVVHDKSSGRHVLIPAGDAAELDLARIAETIMAGFMARGVYPDTRSVIKTAADIAASLRTGDAPNPAP